MSASINCSHGKIGKKILGILCIINLPCLFRAIATELPQCNKTFPNCVNVGQVHKLNLTARVILWKINNTSEPCHGQ